MFFNQYCDFLAVLEAETSRTALTTKLAELFLLLTEDELAPAIYLLQGRVVPEYIPIEFNFSAKSLLKGIQEIANASGVEFNAHVEYETTGDCGDVAEKLLNSMSLNSSKQVSHTPLSLFEVFTIFTNFAQANGQGSMIKKLQLVTTTLSGFSPREAKYFCRIIVGDIRLGVSKKTILDAISWARTGDKSIRPKLDRAYGVRADIGSLAKLVLFGSADPEKIELVVGTPLASQLVEREKDAASIMARMESCIVQAKYDGLRAQLHYSVNGFGDTNVRIFSRNLEPLTTSFPDIVSIFADKKIKSIESIVLDGEIIGYDESTATFLPFQETSQRRRIHNLASTIESIPIRYYIFDLLYLNGEDLTDAPLSRRLKNLSSLNLSNISPKLQLTESPMFNDAQSLEVHFRKLLDAGLEGVIAKKPDSIYSPGKRGFDWIKLKANTFADLKDTVDTVIMGYYYGRGLRAKYGIGGFLMGVYNPELDCYQTVAKVGSGVKEDDWQQFKQQLDQYQVRTLPKNYQISKELMPDVLIMPQIVSELDADEITLSKVHTAGVTAVNSMGLSLRFPRLKVFSRDKRPENSTSPAELLQLYNLGKK